MCIQPRPRGHRCCCCPFWRGNDQMTPQRSTPRLGMCVSNSVCQSIIPALRNKNNTKYRGGVNLPWAIFRICLCCADHRSRKYRDFRHRYKTPGAHDLALNAQNRDFFRFICLYGGTTTSAVNRRRSKYACKFRIHEYTIEKNISQCILNFVMATVRMKHNIITNY